MYMYIYIILLYFQHSFNIFQLDKFHFDLRHFCVNMQSMGLGKDWVSNKGMVI